MWCMYRALAINERRCRLVVLGLELLVTMITLLSKS
jgi:hypothetical protein